ncbi:MAG TPA: CoA-binding protein [Candidatus Acidoferrales bacterium]
MPSRNDDAIRDLLSKAKIIAVVGLSSKRARASFGVSRYLQSVGYRIIPVNPNETEVLGEKAYPDLDAIPKDVKIDIVDIFRRSEEVPEVVDAAIRLGAPAIWMQEGVINDDAAAKARAAGIFVVTDRCLLKDHRRLMP